MSNRVFISHSATGEPETERLRDELSAALREHFDVRVDRDDLEPGEMWRSKINSWLGGCHAAVVLLTHKALNSAYVAYEVSVLTFRPGVVVIPIYLDDVDDAAVRKKLSPTVIQERNAIIESRDVDTSGWEGLDAEERARRRRSQLVEQIKDALLAKKGEMGGDTPIDLQAVRLAQRLTMDRIVIEHHMRELEQCMKELDPRGETDADWKHDSWENKDDLRLTLAHMLMSAGIEGATPVLIEMKDDLDDPEVMENIFGRIATSWVDLSAAGRIKNTATGDPARRVLATNGEKTLIAQLYVQRASGRSFKRNWNVADSNGILSEKVFDILKANVEAALRVKLGNLETPEALEKELKSQERKRQPVFVTLRAEGVNSGVMEKLREAFPTVTFFFLAGRAPTNKKSLSDVNVEFIVPELEEKFEEEFCRMYEDVKNDFC